MSLAAWIKSLFQPAPESTGTWASDFVAGPATPQQPVTYACALACCPSTAYLAIEYPEAFNGHQRGTQRR